jgi:hypothetical protein
MKLAAKMYLWGLLIGVILAFVPSPNFAPAEVNIILSTSNTVILGGLRFKDGDLVNYDPSINTAWRVFSESWFDRGHTNDIDAFDLLPNDHLILSTTETVELGGIQFRDGDLVEYDLATDTATLFFSENLFDRGYSNDIDAVDVLPNGNIVLSTTETTRLGGLRFRDGDLVDYDPVTNSSTLFFSEGLFSHNADIDAVQVLDDGSIILSTTGSAQLGGLRFNKDDLVRYYPYDYSANPYLAGSAAIYFSGGYFENSGANIDAVWDPTDSAPEPATLLLLGLGAIMARRKH